MSLNDELTRGAWARQIIDNPIYQEAFDEVENGIIQKWKDCPIRDQQGAHELKLMLKLLGEVKQHIQTVFDTGKMAEIQTEQERKVTQLRKYGIPA